MKKNDLLILLLICILISFSCGKNKCYIKKAISENIIISPLIYTKDSAIILVSVTSESMISELKKENDIDDIEDFLLKAINKNLPIAVSSEFYHDNLNSRIYVDSVMNMVYKTQGVSGLLKTYFINDGMYIMSSVPVQDTASYMAFGEDSNVGYMAYLLFKHDIYLTYIWLDEDGIIMTIIATELSDMDSFKN